MAEGVAKPNLAFRRSIVRYSLLLIAQFPYNGMYVCCHILQLYFARRAHTLYGLWRSCNTRLATTSSNHPSGDLDSGVERAGHTITPVFNGWQSYVPEAMGVLPSTSGVTSNTVQQ